MEKGRGVPIGEALLLHTLAKRDVTALIDGREAALPEGTRSLEELEVEAAQVGPALMRLSAQILNTEADEELLTQAGTGFELMRLVPPQGEAVAARASEHLRACKCFNVLLAPNEKRSCRYFYRSGWRNVMRCISRKRKAFCTTNFRRCAWHFSESSSQQPFLC